MIGEPFVRFEGVSRKFRRGEFHDSIRDLVPAAFKRALRRRAPAEALSAAEFWALRDVSFNVAPGEALGIIGANGAGKSTALKLLTRILRPTVGRVLVNGRIGSLIELAAGFHPDLTGRENVFLQGAIRGMRRRDIARQFDAIVALSGLEDFIDTPVKRYSSGMNARLGFSIAVHLEPDILVIDEVLSVGDYAFQRKAFDAIQRMVARGMPVVMVSHQLDRIVSLCTHAMLLERGRIACQGSPVDCVATYLTAGGAGPIEETGCPVRLERLALDTTGAIASGRTVRARLAGTVGRDVPPQLTIGLFVRSLHDGRTIFGTSLAGAGMDLPAAGPFELEIELQANMGRGLFALGSRVWDPVERREAAGGPEVVFQVGEDQGFHGSVNLHARLHFSTPAALAAVPRS